MKVVTHSMKRKSEVYEVLINEAIHADTPFEKPDQAKDRKSKHKLNMHMHEVPSMDSLGDPEVDEVQGRSGRVYSGTSIGGLTISDQPRLGAIRLVEEPVLELDVESWGTLEARVVDFKNQIKRLGSSRLALTLSERAYA